jgi:hypothetical protein
MREASTLPSGGALCPTSDHLETWHGGLLNERTVHVEGQLSGSAQEGQETEGLSSVPSGGALRHEHFRAATDVCCGSYKKEVGSNWNWSTKLKGNLHPYLNLSHINWRHCKKNLGNKNNMWLSLIWILKLLKCLINYGWMYDWFLNGWADERNTLLVHGFMAVVY